MSPRSDDLTRRAFFQRVSGGICGAALTHLLAQECGARHGAAEEQAVRPADFRPRPPHHAAKAKSIIHLFMNGGPSQMDLFDPKPMLDKHHGEAYFSKIASEVENPQSAGALMRSPFRFARLFKATFGLPPHAFQIQVRIERARHDLRAGRPLAEAAARAGFADQCHMHRHFRRIVGMTPGQFQATVGKNVQDDYG